MTEPHAQRETAHRYAAGLLDAAAAIAFEDHLLGCEECQTEVRFAAALPRVIHAAPRATRAWWIGGVTVALAAGLVAFFVLPRGNDAKIASLGHVTEPPMYIGMNVRASPAHGDSLFASAMRKYVAGRYEAAASELRIALAAGADTVTSTFFIASSELMAGDAERSVDDFARVIAAGSSAKPYLPESHLYRARALLRLRRSSDALADLAAVGDDDAGVAARARALADSVRQILKR
jgi:hypothetical protein